MAADLDELFLACKARVVDLTRDLSPAQLALPVPATPLWNVEQVLAHVIGVAACNASGDFDGAPGPAWTQRHVDSRAGRSVAELHAEWDEAAPAVVAVLRDGSFPPLADAVSHEHDLRGALGLADHRDDASVRVCGSGFRQGWVGACAEHGLTLDVGTNVVVDAFELMRGGTGRRSAAQVRGWQWSVDPAPFLPHLSRFGSLRETDLAE